MNTCPSMHRIGLILVISLLLLFVGGSADPANGAENRPQASFLQTTTADWRLGTARSVDRRHLDALHTPDILGTDPRGSLRLASHPGTWTRQSTAAPALPRGPANSWDGKNVAEAAVLHDGSQFMMWYSGQDDTTNEWQMGLATSTNGLNWTRYGGNPVLPVGTPGQWDDEEVSFSSVLFDGMTFRTWYSGYDGNTRQVGYASSANGMTWNKHSGPILSGNPGAWDEDLVGNPTVLYDGSIYHMWYGGWSNMTGRWQIGHATSPDGLVWTKDPMPVLEVGPPDSWDDTHVTAPTVLFDGSTFQMWYGGWDDQDYGGYSHGRPGRATSSNGQDWTKDTGNPVFDPTGGIWDPLWAVDPEVIFDGDLYHLWYTGGVTWTGLQIGYAIAPPIYENSGTYTSSLVDSACPAGTIPQWDGLRVQQTRHGQSIVYTILDQSGQHVPGFDSLTADPWEYLFDLSALPGAYRQIYLQATLSTTDAAYSPVLEEWQLIWICRELPYLFFLPVVMK